MKIIYMALFSLLYGCSTTVPVTAKFPPAPKSLTEKCAELKKLNNDPVTIVELHTTVIENYTHYYECAVKVEEWNTWYVKQKKIFEEVK